MEEKCVFCVVYSTTNQSHISFIKNLTSMIEVKDVIDHIDKKVEGEIINLIIIDYEGERCLFFNGHDKNFARSFLKEVSNMGEDQINFFLREEIGVLSS